MIVRSQTNTL